MLIGVPEVDEERTVHSFGVWGVGLEIDSLVLLTQRVLKERLLLLVLFTHLEVLLPVPFDEAAMISRVSYSLLFSNADVSASRLGSDY